MDQPVRVVLDTNVVLDWLVFDDARVRRIGAALAHGALTLISDALCLAELEDVLQRPAIRMDAVRRKDARERYLACAHLMPLAPADLSLPRCRDPDDQPFLDLAARTRSAVLVTRDRELLRLDPAMRLACAVAVLEPEQAAVELAL